MAPCITLCKCTTCRCATTTHIHIIPLIRCTLGSALTSALHTPRDSRCLATTLHATVCCASYNNHCCPIEVVLLGSATHVVKFNCRQRHVDANSVRWASNTSNGCDGLTASMQSCKAAMPHGILILGVVLSPLRSCTTTQPRCPQ